MREKQKNKWVWEAIMEIGVDRNCKNRKVCKYHSENKGEEGVSR